MMRVFPFLIGIVLLVACVPDNMPVHFRQPTVPDETTATGETTDMPNEATPQTVDSLEVEKPQPMHIEIHVLTGSLLMGSLDARKRLTVYEDYDCIYCREFGAVDLPWLLMNHAQKETMSIERIFVSSSPEGTLMASAAICSAEQSRFSETDHELHVHPISSKTELPALAKKLTLDAKKLGTCIASQGTAAFLKTAQERAKRDGITRFPSFTLGTDHWMGVLTREDLKKRIENAL